MAASHLPLPTKGSTYVLRSLDSKTLIGKCICLPPYPGAQRMSISNPGGRCNPMFVVYETDVNDGVPKVARDDSCKPVVYSYLKRSGKSGTKKVWVSNKIATMARLSSGELAWKMSVEGRLYYVEEKV